MRKTLYAGLFYIALSIAFVAFFYARSYGEMTKLCGQMGYDGGAWACFYHGPLSSFWIKLSLVALVPFAIGVIMIIRGAAQYIKHKE